MSFNRVPVRWSCKVIFAPDLDAHAQRSSPAVPVRLRGQVTKALDLDARMQRQLHQALQKVN